MRPMMDISVPLWVRKDRKLLKAFSLGVLKGFGKCNNLPEGLTKPQKHNIIRHAFLINSCGSIRTRKSVLKIGRGNFEFVAGLTPHTELSFRNGKPRNTFREQAE